MSSSHWNCRETARHRSQLSFLMCSTTLLQPFLRDFGHSIRCGETVQTARYSGGNSNAGFFLQGHPGADTITISPHLWYASCVVIIKASTPSMRPAVTTISRSLPSSRQSVLLTARVSLQIRLLDPQQLFLW